MAGSIILSLAFVLSLFSMVIYFRAFRGATGLVNYGRIAYHGMTMLVILASTYLLYAILTHQYQYKYIYSYSNADLSTGFLMSTFWAGQEGSFMLWLLLTCIVGVFLQSYVSKRGELEYSVMAVFTLSTTFLLAMVSPLLKNPFELIWTDPSFIDIKHINQALLNHPVLQSFLFSDPNSGQNFFKFDSESYAKLQAAGFAVSDVLVKGKGLNPLLQNFWMQIHPPILFTGFSMASVPFAFAISALMRNDYKDWVRQAFPWVLAGAGILGLGIMLGGYWAYGVLGWGGYWAWDPVENSSLVPWLVSAAALHTMVVQRKSQSKGDNVGRFAKTNLIFSILIYVLVIYSTFLTRSGILGDSSVHSFGEPGQSVYVFLLVFIISFTGLGVGMVVFRWKHLNEMVQAEEGLLSRELALFTATVALAASALIVLVGTSAPLLNQSVETSFYNEMHVPLAIIVGLLNGISLTLRWKNSNAIEVWQKGKMSIIASLAVTIGAVVFGGVYKSMMILLTLSSAFTLFINGEIAYKVVRGNINMAGAYLAHI
ncbi:MAG: cytochrome c biogenesis protein CcsA, partial [Ignavibacteriales bacterium]|nr:cytochrome c biogenesis protein CcsA [Ignavibacteriales bacterium]